MNNSIVNTATGAGRRVRAFGGEVIFHLEGQHTGGKLTQWTELTPPGGGPPPHRHEKEDELFLVQEGQVQFLLNGQWQEAAPGTVIFAERGKVHTFKNVGPKQSKMLVTTFPSGFETFFTRCADEFNQAGGPNMERIVSISAEHGIYFAQ